MRRFRNPRYAPESLERKLNPSTVSPLPADYSTIDPAATTTDGSSEYWSPSYEDDWVYVASTDPSESPSNPYPDPAPPDDPGGPGYYWSPDYV